MEQNPLAAVDLNLLIVLDELLTTRSVTRTAGRLDLSQPAVSNALARLRRQFGDALLVRTPNGMAPTTRAVALQKPLRDALHALGQQLFSREDFRPETSTRRFSIAGTDYVQFVLLPQLVATLRRSAPGVTLRVVPIASRFPWTELETGDLDLAIGRAPQMPKGLRRRALFTDRIVCMVRREHPRARGPLDLEQYLALDHLDALPIEAPGLADVYLAKIGKKRRVSTIVPHFLVAPFIVQNTDCCFTLSERLARPLAQLLRTRVHALPFPAPEFSVHAYWHERHHADEGHRWLRATVHAAAREGV